MSGKIRHRLKRFRTREGLTQQELARRLGVSRQTVISLEQGRYAPSLELAIRIIQCFDCSFEEMFVLRQNDSTPSPDSSHSITRRESAHPRAQIYLRNLPFLD